MNEYKKAILVLSAGIKKNKDGKWVSTGIQEVDFALGAPGGILRIEAANYLFNNDSNLTIITSGGRGWDIKNDEESRPNLAEIMKQELIQLGVSDYKIIKEEESNKTYGQLLKIESLIEQFGFREIKIITNQYHLERVEAMLNNEESMKSFFNKGLIEPVVAEDVCMKYDPEKWNLVIKDFYSFSEMQNIIKNEKQGAKQIKEGTYNFGNI